VESSAERYGQCGGDSSRLSSKTEMRGSRREEVRLTGMEPSTAAAALSAVPSSKATPPEW